MAAAKAGRDLSPAAAYREADAAARARAEEEAVLTAEELALFAVPPAVDAIGPGAASRA